MREQEKEFPDDDNEFFDEFVNMVKTINKLSEPLVFEKQDRKPQLLIYGEMGNGKSTTGNMLMREL
jgi:hypothetical protein